MESLPRRDASQEPLIFSRRIYLVKIIYIHIDAHAHAEIRTGISNWKVWANLPYVPFNTGSHMAYLSGRIGTWTRPYTRLSGMSSLRFSRHATTLIGWFNTAETWSETRSAGRHDSLHAIFLREYLAPITRGRTSRLHSTNGAIFSLADNVKLYIPEVPQGPSFLKPRRAMYDRRSLAAREIIISMNRYGYAFILISDIKKFFITFYEVFHSGRRLSRERLGDGEREKKYGIYWC